MSTQPRRASRKVKKLTGDKALKRFATQGYRPMYRPGHVNHCPGCSKCNWWVSNTTAECAFCGTAMDIEGASHSSTRIVAHRPQASEFVHTDGRARIESMDPPSGFARMLGMIIG